MSYQILSDGLADDVKEGLMQQEAMDEILKQRRIFDQLRSEIEAKYRTRVVGVAEGKIFVADDPQELFSKVRAELPGKLVYFEAIGFDL